jgi:DNA-binding CsgD family transcriptional regulator
MDGSMADEPERSLGSTAGKPISVSSLAPFELQPKTFQAFYEARENLDLDTKEHLLARITPRELVFIEYLCQHPEETDEEVMAALGLSERTVLAYFAHLGRNFKVRNTSELRRWAMDKRLVSIPHVGPEEELPDNEADKEPDKGFDPWVRWY